MVAATRAATDQDAGRFRIIITDETVDRYHEVIKADGWDFANYKNNPVVLAFHDYSSLPVGVTETLVREGSGWVAEGRFAPESCNPFAQQIRRLYDAGFLRTASVGLIPKEFDTDGMTITKAELLEWSFVPVPANPSAISVMNGLNLDVPMLRSKGLIVDMREETKAEETEKGIVEDVAAAAADVTWDMMDAKYDELDEVYAIMGALCEVYLRPETPVEAFKALLQEAIVLLQAEVNEKPEAEQAEMEKMAKTFLGKFKSEHMPTKEKAGKKISKASRAILDEAIEHCSAVAEHADGASAALKSLLDDITEDGADDEEEETGDAGDQEDDGDSSKSKKVSDGVTDELRKYRLNKEALVEIVNIASGTLAVINKKKSK